MELFISWSGPSSKELARVLRAWVPEVIQGARPWMSSEDLRKGDMWGREVTEHLAATAHGIVCVTADNLDSRWLNFEAGALAKSLGQSRVWTALLGIGPTDVTGPLALFQATEIGDRADVLKLMESINEVQEGGLEDDRLLRAFDRLWPELREKVAKIDFVSEEQIPDRAPEDLLTEVLERVRGLERRLEAPSGPQARHRGELFPDLADWPDYERARHAAQFRVGDIVEHRNFGRGVIASTAGEREQREATVDFEGVGRKQLLLGYAPLYVVKRSEED